MLNFIKSIFHKSTSRQLNIYDALDQSLQSGLHSVNWSNVVWVAL